MIGTQPHSALPPRRGQAWSEEEDRQLYEGFLAGHAMDRMASAHQRSIGGIAARLRRLGLIDANGEIVEPPPPFAVPAPRRSKPKESRSAGADGGALSLIFAMAAADGWRVEVRSNRPLNKPMVERLTLMLQSGITDAEPQTC
jgi:hypothetical protein